MKPSALILTAGIVVWALFACVPPPQASRTTTVCTSGALNDVPFLAVPFNPRLNQTPTADSTTPINQDVQLDLNAAFSAAAGFQTALCGLDGIFIDPTGCQKDPSTGSYDPRSCGLAPQQIADHSWGLRTYPPNPLPGKRYIGLSLGLWENDPNNPWPCQSPHQGQVCAPPFPTYHNKLIRAQLQALSANAVNDNSPPYYDNVYPNSAAMTVLAALSHEFGHVLWWQTFVQPPGNLHTTNTTTFCNGIFYPANLWSTPVDVPPNRWIGFGQTRDVPSGAEISKVKGGLDRGSPQNPKGFRDAGDHLDIIYSNGLWASALAAFSPDEEFVETFQLHALLSANPKLQHLEIVITGNHGKHRHDPPAHLNPNSVLGKELQCF